MIYLNLINDKIYQLVNSSRNDYDCLIYFISCHGIIYDSKGNKFPLIAIFNKFCNQKCFQLRNKPKIYFKEACRGNTRTKNYNNSVFNDTIQTGNNMNTMSTTVGIDGDTMNNSIVSYDTDNNFNTVINTSNNNDEKYDGKQTDTKTDDKNGNNNVFSKYNYNREIYANTDGFGVVEPGSRGAYMTRSITKCIVNDKIFEKDFDEIMIHARHVMLELMGKSVDCGAQVIDDHNAIPRKIIFKQKYVHSQVIFVR